MRRVNRRSRNFRRKVLMSGLAIGMVFSHPIATYAFQNNNISTMSTTAISVGDVFTTKIMHDGVEDLDCKFKILRTASRSTKGTVQIGDENGPAIDKDTRGKITLPEEVTDTTGNIYTVVRVGYMAFEKCGGITNTGLENNTTITTIDKCAFLKCISLEDTGLGTNTTVTSIGDSAFESCYALKDTGLGTNTKLTSLGIRIFYSCTGLKNTGLGTNSTIKYLGHLVFEKCTGLEVTGLGTNSTITTMGQGVFSDCDSLENTGLETNTTLTNLEENTFFSCEGLKTTGLETNTTIKNVGEDTFIGCTGLSDIVFDRIELPQIGTGVFSYTNVKIYYLPEAINKEAIANTGATAIEMVADRINIEKTPTKIEYIEGQEMDLSGLKVKLIYKGGTEDKLAKDIEYTDATKDRFTSDKTELNINDKEVNISYLGKIAKQTIKVLEKEVTDILIKNTPLKVEYKDGEDVDLSGLVLTVTYDNGKSEDIIYDAKSMNDFKINKTQLAKGDKDIIITYGGKEVKQTIKVVNKQVKSILLKKAPNKVDYKEDEKVDLSGLILTVTYDNGKSENVVYNEKSMNNFKTNKTQLAKGDDEIVITYVGKTVKHPIKVKEIEEIVIDKISDKKEVINNTYNKTSISKKEKNVIKTSDISNTSLYIGATIVAGSILLIVEINKKRKQKQ